MYPCTPTTVFKDLFERAREAIAPVGGLSDAELHAEPLPPIAWFAWRMGRVLDHNFSGLIQLDQLWTAGAWHERFGMASEPGDFLPTSPLASEIVRSFRAPSAQLLLDYFDATHERAKAYLDTLDDSDLDRVLDEPRFDPLPTVNVRLVSVAFALGQCSGPIRYRLWMASQGR